MRMIVLVRIVVSVCPPSRTTTRARIMTVVAVGDVFFALKLRVLATLRSSYM